MEFFASAFASWLFGQVANACRKRLVSWVLGGDHDRALQQAANSAIQSTAMQWRPEGGEGSTELAMIIDQVFKKILPIFPQAEYPTLLQTLQAGIMTQLSILDDATVTGTGRSSSDILGISSTALAESLNDHLVQEIRRRGAIGGPLNSLADQLNHDATHLQNQDTRKEVGYLSRSLNELQRQIGSDPSFPEYARLMLPRVGVFREQRDSHRRVSYVNDTSILLYLIEEYVRLGAVDIAVDPYRYENALPTLPAAFRRRIVEIDHGDSTKAALQFIAPIAIEQNAKITGTNYGIESIQYRPELPDRNKSALSALAVGLENFIRGMRNGLQVAMDIDELRASVRILLEVSRVPEARANLATIEQVLSTYRLHRVGAVKMISTASERMVELFQDLVNDPLYRDLSRNVLGMGQVGEAGISAIRTSEVAKRLAEQNEALRFGNRSTSIPSANLHLSNSAASGYFDRRYFPPIVPFKKALAKAKANWSRLAPEFVPPGTYPELERFHVSREDHPPS